MKKKLQKCLTITLVNTSIGIIYQNRPYATINQLFKKSNIRSLLSFVLFVLFLSSYLKSLAKSFDDRKDKRKLLSSIKQYYFDKTGLIDIKAMIFVFKIIIT